MRPAFRLFRAAARAGDSGCQVNLGNCYSDGMGVKPNLRWALLWYRRAYRQGDCTAANNIAIVLRDEKKLYPALAWFARAIKRKDADANLHIAEIYLQLGDQPKALRYLKQVCSARPGCVTQHSLEQARILLEAF
jgi:TPR repeat protein